MSNLNKKIIDIEIDNKKYIMTFDMKSIEVYKEISNKSFVLSVTDLTRFDDKAIIDFMAAAIRPEDDPTTPIGAKIYDMDILDLLLNYSSVVIGLVLGSLPNKKDAKKK